MNIITLTDNERTFCAHILTNDDFIRDNDIHDAKALDGAATWSDGIGDGFVGNAAGTVSSLCTKGVLESRCGESLTVTAAGAEILSRIAKSEEIPW